MTEELRRRIEELVSDPQVAGRIVEACEEEELSRKERQRSLQRMGIEEAKKRGVRLGRPRLEINKEFYQMIELYRKGNLTQKQAADSLGISLKTFRARLREVEMRERV
ncbi:MAG: winged helix-turn-helix transcriptional regulator [Lachnospiraceae bacterium]